MENVVTKSLFKNISICIVLFPIDHINAMYLMCSYDKAFKPNEVSPWCAVFTEEQLKVIVLREFSF